MEYIFGMWDWYIAGPLIGLFVPLMLLVGNKLFGISSSFVHACALVLPKKASGVLQYDMKKHAWKFYFVIGIALGAFISVNFLSDPDVVFLPAKYYTSAGFLQLFAGGIFVGFGTRYANGCTSGHAITGLSLLNPASLISTMAFFASGMLYTNLIHYIFN